MVELSHSAHATSISKSLNRTFRHVRERVVQSFKLRS